MGEEIERLRTAASLIREINMGATAIGTGINTDPDYAERVRAELSRVTGQELVTSPDLCGGDAGHGRLRPSAVAREALESNRGVYELVLEKEWMTREELDEVLSPDAMTKPRGMKPERRQAERRRRD